MRDITKTAEKDRRLGHSSVDIMNRTPFLGYERVEYRFLQNYIEANKDRRTKEVKRYVKIAKKMIKYYEDKRDTEEAIKLIERHFYST